MTAKKLISMAGRRIKDSQTSEVESCGGVNITLLGGIKERGSRSRSGSPGLREAPAAAPPVPQQNGEQRHADARNGIWSPNLMWPGEGENKLIFQQ